ncbi:NACHT, LRR and PYD domains-containing protein 6-like isoform X2 [Clupea harengus]|uniref:NACHT, LRR and PYD domains-containing protein 6-like isoform X2 n=1 Tax=Clupea harengus TaxID=7950 RepID=A0A6P8F3Q4_CLUHA|nr:NACHT, LRR and PYD domains-containing protein 6-like isoform X2 [Clupea harengus]XP_042559672.1 NACHT, LRR and PYD domains-containing protein 6-like isoform X2 [Clupea harengus]
MAVLSAVKSGLEFALEVSEYVSPVLTVASALYGCYEEVKANKERCGRLVERVKVIESVVVAVTDEDLDNPLVQGALTKLKKILTSAEELVRNNGNKHWLLRAMKANNLKDQFVDLNKRLSEVSDQLSLCLQLEQLKKLREAFEAQRREEEDQRDAEDDQLGWQKVLEGMNKTVNIIQRDVNDLQSGQNNLQNDISDIKTILQKQGEMRKSECDTVDRSTSEPNSQKSYETSIDQYKAHIKKTWNLVREYNSRPGADYVVMSERYIDLLIVQKHRELKEREQEIRQKGEELYQVFTRASKDYLCTSLEQLFSPDSKGEVPKAVILQGHSGYGKSFTAQKIMYDWASDEMYKDSFDFVFHLKVKELNGVKDELRLVDLLQCDGIDKPTVLKVLQDIPERVLFLVDGFDELRLSHVDSLQFSHRDRGTVNVVLAALLSGRMLCKSSLLVTTRSTALKALSDMLKGPQRFTEILGFSDRGVENYFQAFFAREEDPEAGIKALKHVKDNETLLTACFIPVTCWIVCNVFKDVFKGGTDIITDLDTSTSIFAHFVFTQMKHHGSDLDESEWTNLLKNLGELAADGITKQKVLFDEYDVKQKVSNHRLVPFLCKFFLRKLNVETKYSFMHLSFQEFFAALFYLLSDTDIAREQVEEMLLKVKQGLNVTDQKLHMSHLLPVIQFLFGLSNKEVTSSHQLSAFPEIRSLLEDWICDLIEAEEGLPRTHNIQLFILQCLYEVHEEGFVQKVMENWNRINLDGIPLKKTDCSVLAYCVRHCQDMERLTLTHCNLTAEKLKVLTEALVKCKELGLVVEDLRDGEDLITALGEDKIVTDLHLKNSSLSLGGLVQVLNALAKQRRVDAVDLTLRIPYENSTATTITTEKEDMCGHHTDTPQEGETDGLDINLERKIISTEPLRCKHTLTLGLGAQIGQSEPCMLQISISQAASSERFSNTWTDLLQTVYTSRPLSCTALQSSLIRVPDVKMVELVFSSLTVDVATKFLSLFQACPTLQSGGCKQSEKAGGQGESLCSDLVCLRMTSAFYQLTVKHPPGDLFSEITLAIATPLEESDWPCVFQKLSTLSEVPGGVDLTFLHAVRGLQRLMLQVTCLIERWAADLLSLIQTPACSPLEYCSSVTALSDSSGCFHCTSCRLLSAAWCFLQVKLKLFTVFAAFPSIGSLL